jgi:hypothetical protein
MLVEEDFSRSLGPFAQRDDRDAARYTTFTRQVHGLASRIGRWPGE